MSDEQTVKPRNTASDALLLFGILGIAIGLVLAGVMNTRAQADKNVSDFTYSLGGIGSTAGVSADYGWMWFGIILAILGALSLLSLLVISAARRPVA